jgi:hypothetical protein
MRLLGGAPDRGQDSEAPPTIQRAQHRCACWKASRTWIGANPFGGNWEPKNHAQFLAHVEAV